MLIVVRLTKGQAYKVGRLLGSELKNMTSGNLRRVIIGGLVKVSIAEVG